MVAFVKLLVFLLLACSVQAVSKKPEFKSVIAIDPASKVPSYSVGAFEAFLAKFPAPYYSTVTIGDSRAGKSETGNFRVQMNAREPVPKEAIFRVCDMLEPCTKGIDVVAILRADGTGTDLYFDVVGGNMAENAADMNVFLTVAACLSSDPLVLVDTNLNDNTVQLVGRIAAHLLDQSNNGASCSFREGGPALAIVVNKNDGAVRQEAQPGGLRAIWDKSTAALTKEAVFINQVFKDIMFFALPFVNDPSQRVLDSPFGQLVRAMDLQLVAKAKPVTLAPESGVGARIQGTAATIAVALGDTFNQSLALSKDGFHGPPRVQDFVERDAKNATSACKTAYQTAAAKSATPACEARCSGEGRGCQVVHEWLAPARVAAEKCFVDATAKWREGGNPFGASVLDPALKQLNADTQHRADELHSAWQQANSVDPARTQHESRTREIRRWGPNQCSSRYGSKCVLGFGGGRKYADFCTNAEFVVEARSCTFKRCGASLGCTDWKETSRFEKEVAKDKRNVCYVYGCPFRKGLCCHRSQG